MLVDNVNPAKEKLRAGGKLSACWLQAGSGVTAEIVAEAGVDVGVIDLEHGPGDIMILASQIQAMKNCPAVPFARAPWNDMVAIKRILDAGVYGLIVPYVNTREEAVRAVAAAQYPPAGVRGIAGSPRAAHYANQSIEYLKRANDAIFIFTQVETVEAIRNLDAILTVERLDGIFIGPMDLSTSMGRFASPGDPDVKDAILGIEKKVLQAGKILATVGSGWEDAKEKYDRGYGLVIYLSDTMTLGQAIRERIAPFKKTFGGL
ncbi:MAG: 2,4-dihydroxyhept-2-ene-1,7-dioic acid aldolase [Planctomycetota bacterium]|jgi:2-dehydro-3-deoxyglucarate aldolase/4-hydroxy-2-oxoheptanedioate aldolase|nr:2,4-dihydroxyhept-2-ene-1,7-dioic acid aldolase [Planctomycetota bacterium]